MVYNPRNENFQEPAIHEKDLNNLDIVSLKAPFRTENMISIFKRNRNDFHLSGYPYSIIIWEERMSSSFSHSSKEGTIKRLPGIIWSGLLMPFTAASIFQFSGCNV